jgi:sedoheptulokinase
MKILGIDIGTTTVTALVLDTETKSVVKSCTLKNDSFIEGKSFEKLQDPQKIIETVKSAVKEVTFYAYPDAIGITGQMHGILYLDKDNNPCSPLMIWQDERGNEKYSDSETYAEYLTRVTGIKSASGFGLTTHFYNLKNDLVPEDAVMLSTIHDYLGALLTDTKPVTHSSDGASLGFFDLEELRFDRKALEIAGINEDFLPRVISGTECIGNTKCDFLPEGIPVAVAIGDNQASFLGSVADPENSVLVNVGTGSQVSFMTNEVVTPRLGEIRPLTEDKYIFVGASLCGGRAYAILKSFFSMCSDFLGGSDEDLYTKMDALAETSRNEENPLFVNCEFCGTREDPDSRGSIEDISADNFTPANLIYGVLDGVANELYDMYEQAMFSLVFSHENLICSGNGLRKSDLWRKIFEDHFSMSAELPLHSEEAAVGACVFSGAASGIFKDIKASQDALLR